MINRSFLRTGVCAAAALTLGAGMASATTLRITVNNPNDPGGFAITPLYTAFHDGTFDAFDVGDEASDGVEVIAETGAASTVAGERLDVDPDSVGGVVNTSAGPPPIQPGETASIEIDVEASSALYFTYLAMLLPSNDTFIGNDNPLAYQIFDDAGNFLGPQTINVTGLDIYDAGTEANGLLGSAFVAGQDIGLSPDDSSDVITQGIFDLDVFAGATLATLETLTDDLGRLDFLSDPANFSVVSITIEEVAPIPLPASAAAMLLALGGLGFASRKRRKA